MKQLLILVMCCLASASASAKSPKPQDKQAYTGSDGTWRIQSTTSVGDCSALIPSSITIADKKIDETSGASVSAWGYVDDAGAISARFTSAGDHVARFHGQFRGATGSGAWSSSTDLCGGSWRATRE